MVIKVFIFVLIGLIAVNIAVAEELKCYQCLKCDKVEENQLKVCTADDYPAETTTVATETTTVATDATTKATDATTKATDATTATTKTVSQSLLKDGETETTTGSTAMEYSCYKVKDEEGKTNYGCTKKVSNCDDLKLPGKDECLKVCDTEGCNPATNIQSLAFSTIIFVAIAKMFLN